MFRSQRAVTLMLPPEGAARFFRPMVDQCHLKGLKPPLDLRSPVGALAALGRGNLGAAVSFWQARAVYRFAGCSAHNHDISGRPADYMVPDRRARERLNLALALSRNRPAHSIGRRDSTLFFEGDQRDDIYLLKTGAVRFCRYSEDGQRTVAGFAVGGELFSLAMDGRHIYTAEFAADSEYLAVSRRAGVDDQSDERLARRLQHFLADEPWYMNEVFTEMLHRSASERLAFFLMDLGLRRLGRLVDGSTFASGLPRRDIVDFLGLRPETISRAYTGLAKAGAAVEKFGQVTVLSVSHLRAAAGAGKIRPEIRMIDRRWR